MHTSNFAPRAPAPTYRAAVGHGRVFQRPADAADYSAAWRAFPRKPATEFGTPSWMGWADRRDEEFTAAHACDMDDMAGFSKQASAALTHTILAAVSTRGM